MSKTTNSGPLRVGYAAAPTDSSIGPVLLGKTFSSYPGYPGTLPSGTNPNGSAYLLNFDATLVQTLTITLPANAQIVAFDIDVLTAYDSATSATLTIGTAAAGTQYVGSINAKTAGRASPTYSAAQLTAMSNITTNTTVYATVTSVGQPTAGSVLITCRYIQW